MKNLKEVLELHKKWLNYEKSGIRADLSGADLRGTNLRGFDLSYADLSYVNLSYVNLSCANLRGANLKCANLNKADFNYANLSETNLNDANLSGADLSRADLREANLINTNLNDANLIYANLNEANLSCANLSNADLRGANLNASNLSGADLSDIKYNYLSIGLNLVCPKEGSYIGYKKAKNEQKEEVIIKLLITEDALRSSATTRKCRCSKAKVLSITSLDETKSYDEAYSAWDDTFVYKVGEIAKVDDFNTNRWEECSTGIHHFITRKEAVEY